MSTYDNTFTRDRLTARLINVHVTVILITLPLGWERHIARRVSVCPHVCPCACTPMCLCQYVCMSLRTLVHVSLWGALKAQVLENASTQKASTKQRISQWWKTHVRKTQVRKMQVQCDSHMLFNWCLKRKVAQRKNKINGVSCLIVKPHGSRYCTATHGTVGIGGD